MTRRDDGGGGLFHLVVIKALDPRDEAQRGQDLRLDLQRDAKFGGDVVRAERDAGTGPEEHHRRLQACGVVPPVIDDDLRD